MRFTYTKVEGFEPAVLGVRFPMCRSYEEAKEKSDSYYDNNNFIIGSDDLRICKNLISADNNSSSQPNSKFLRMIHVQVVITAPMYFMAELDTYKVGTTRNSSSFQHKGTSKRFEIEDFEVDERIKEVLSIKEKEYDKLTYPYETDEYRIYTCENGRQYKVFKNGRVFSCAYDLPDVTGRVRHFEERECQPSLTTSGYYELNIGGRNGERWVVHRLVATCWIDNPEHKSTVDHLDMNKGNNSVENLEWVDLEENIKREWENHKGFDLQKAYKNWKMSSKMTPSERMRVKDLYKNGLSQEEISKSTGLSRSQISVIVRDADNTSNNRELFEKCWYWEQDLDKLNALRDKYLDTKDYEYFREIRQLLPSSYCYTSMFDCDYATLRNICKWRKNHKLIEWHKFCDWAKTLPYAQEFLFD